MALVGLPTKNLHIKEKPKNVHGVDYSEHMVAKPIVSMTTVEKSVKGELMTGYGGAESVTENPGVFEEKPGMSIMVEGSRTLNLGNYESAKITVGINVPCGPASLTAAYDWATEWVSGRIEAAVKDAKGI